MSHMLHMLTHNLIMPHTKHAHVSHAHHAYTHHVFLYAKVYTCTYYGQKDHWAKFCYDRINTSNDHILVQKIITLGPKKVWVAKSTNFLLNIGTHQGFKM